MGIEITDDELWSMDPELLIKLQAHLNKHRKKLLDSVVPEDGKEKISEKIDKTLQELSVIKSLDMADTTAQFEEVQTVQGQFLGTRITQSDRTYIARQWHITDEVWQILGAAVKAGYGKFWRHSHPQDSYFLGSKNYLKGSHHIGCSLSHFDPWIFVLGAECLSKKSGLQTVKEITFNKNVGHLVQECLNVEYSEPQIEGDIKRGRFRVQTNGGHNYTTHKNDFEKIINHVALNQRSQF
jgi:hypothetical protein